MDAAYTLKNGSASQVEAYRAQQQQQVAQNQATAVLRGRSAPSVLLQRARCLTSAGSCADPATPTLLLHAICGACAGSCRPLSPTCSSH